MLQRARSVDQAFLKRPISPAFVALAPPERRLAAAHQVAQQRQHLRGFFRRHASWPLHGDSCRYDGF
jgi:hypothetical protein